MWICTISDLCILYHNKQYVGLLPVKVNWWYFNIFQLMIISTFCLRTASLSDAKSLLSEMSWIDSESGHISKWLVRSLSPGLPLKQTEQNGKTELDNGGLRKLGSFKERERFGKGGCRGKWTACSFSNWSLLSTERKHSLSQLLGALEGDFQWSEGRVG